MCPNSNVQSRACVLCDRVSDRWCKSKSSILTLEHFRTVIAHTTQLIINVGNDTYAPNNALNISFMISACHMLQRIANASAPNPALPPGSTIASYLYVTAQHKP